VAATAEFLKLATIHCNKKGLAIKEITPKNDVFVKARLLCAEFKYYDCSKHVAIGVNLTTLNKVCSRIIYGEPLELNCERDATTFTIKSMFLSNLDTPRGTRRIDCEYKLNQMVTLTDDGFDMSPQTYYRARLTIPPELYRTAVRKVCTDSTRFV